MYSSGVESPYASPSGVAKLVVPGPAVPRTVAGFPARPRQADRHEPETLLVSPEHVPDLLLRHEPAVQVLGVMAGNAEDGVDAFGDEALDDRFRAGHDGHGSRASVVWSAPMVAEVDYRRSPDTLPIARRANRHSCVASGTRSSASESP